MVRWNVAEVMASSDLVELPAMARDILEKKEAAGVSSQDPTCQQSSDIRRSLKVLSEYREQLPSRQTVVLAITDLQVKAALCGPCQSSTTCWALCGAQGVFSKLAKRRKRNRQRMEPAV